MKKQPNPIDATVRATASPWCAAIKDGPVWFSVSSQHRFDDRKAAEVWIEENQPRWMGKLVAKLALECGRK